jgi:hypothetical protein
MANPASGSLAMRIVPQLAPPSGAARSRPCRRSPPHATARRIGLFAAPNGTLLNSGLVAVPGRVVIGQVAIHHPLPDRNDRNADADRSGFAR